jgi:hypothetical protein
MDTQKKQLTWNNFLAWSKTSVQSKTIALMTTEQRDSIIETAEKALLAQARKGLCDENMKVCLPPHRTTFITFLLCDSPYFILFTIDEIHCAG